MVEVATEVRADDLLVPGPALGPSQQVQTAPDFRGAQADDLVRGVPALVLQQAQQVQQVQGSRGVQVRTTQENVSVTQSRQDSVFRKFLVKKPHPGFVVSSTPSNWFSSDFHNKVPVSSVTTPSPSSASMSAPSSSSSMSMEASSSNLPCDGLQEQGEELSACNVESRNKIISELVHDSLSEGTQRIYKLHFQLFKNFGQLSGVKVTDFTFNFNFVCQFLLMSP